LKIKLKTATKLSLFLFLLCPVVFMISCKAPEQKNPLADLAQTPPMGWNSWNKFGCNVDENMIKEMADAIVSSGMREAGYEFIVIDDCWQISRGSEGNIVEDSEHFPSGIKALADYVHSKGLKFGLYSCAGTKTCQGRPGSKEYEEKDAKQYARWGVDYLKYDWCNTKGMDATQAYTKMRKALEAAGRPIVFSICEWGTNKPWLWAENIGHCWDCTRDWGGMGFIHILDLQVGLEDYAGPGHWNDPDMLEVGNKGLNTTECRAHFSLWCILAAPLMAGNDLRNMSDEIREIMTNNEAIAVDQDPLGIQGRKVRDDGDLEVWSKLLKDGSRAVVLFNRRSGDAEITVTWQEIELSVQEAAVRDLWAKKDLGRFQDSFSAAVPSHGVVMVKITP
jgi:alpha-galactosidase